MTQAVVLSGTVVVAPGVTVMTSKPSTETLLAAARKVDHEQRMRQRAVVIPDQRKEQSRRACRGPVNRHDD